MRATPCGFFAPAAGRLLGKGLRGLCPTADGKRPTATGQAYLGRIRRGLWPKALTRAEAARLAAEAADGAARPSLELGIDEAARGPGAAPADLQAAGALGSAAGRPRCSPERPTNAPAAKRARAAS